MNMPVDNDLKKLFETWVDSDLKAQLIVFFHNNPGVIETADGLARRLGINAKRLREEISDHVSLGLVKEHVVGGKTLLMYDRAAESNVQALVAKQLRDRLPGVG